VLGIEGDLIAAIRSAGLVEYMRHTRTILDAWVYYRRFAESVLDVKAGTSDQVPS
jgi:CRISPR-associated protein Cmr5